MLLSYMYIYIYIYMLYTCSCITNHSNTYIMVAPVFPVLEQITNEIGTPEPNWSPR